ncbi:hypothetical protein KUCAC02_014200, partial [Chaenocephalus aceratus]
QWSLKSEQTLISLCPPAWLTLTPNGIHVLCLSLATVEESTTLVAVRCQEGQDEALLFSVFLKIASLCARSVCTNLNLLLLLPDTVPHGSSDLHTQMWTPHKPTVNEREGKESERKNERVRDDCDRMIEGREGMQQSEEEFHDNPASGPKHSCVSFVTNAHLSSTLGRGPVFPSCSPHSVMATTHPTADEPI